MQRYRLPYAEWGWLEFQSAISAFGRGQIRYGPHITELECRLADLLGESRVFALNSGRTALRIGLEALAKLRPDREEVIIPAFICPAVVNAVKSAGLRPVLADVGVDLNLQLATTRGLICTRTLGIIVAHMYGCPAEIVAFENLAREAGIFLVDDAAQVMGETVQGRMLGTFGDLGLVSFAQSKCLVAGESGAGGILICKNLELLPLLQASIESLPFSESRGKAFVAFVWSYLLAPYTSRANYYWSRISQGLIEVNTKVITPKKISNLDAKTVLCQLNSLPQRRKERIDTINNYAHQLSPISGRIWMPQYAPNRYLSRVMALLSSASHPDKCQIALRQEFVQTRRSYPVYLHAGNSCPNAEKFAAHLIELPSFSGMTDADVAHVCNILKTVTEMQGNSRQPSGEFSA